LGPTSARRRGRPGGGHDAARSERVSTRPCTLRGLVLCSDDQGLACGARRRITRRLRPGL